MRINVELQHALALSRDRYAGDSDVLTESRSAGEDTASVEWWELDGGGKGDRGWRGRRDGAALAAYRDLAQHAVEPVAENEFPVEFAFRDGWGRPDKDIIKQGLRRGYLAPVLQDGRLTRFRITVEGATLLNALGLDARA
ncbi:hypothetical protein ASG52_25360 [Methylobacterium sp. Leaf456]|uniref:hypothetical protein n=1 Tax=Methylobacterium sp. Leaf456 TaxID=1736382 RepID=UPI0006F9094E|nr:hypothetical protein [Methylobacterium sp. Leaf456]KQT53184.1 hypothetical protein ASG52_25360 [Methylobacterium sp. Leaf456]